VSGFIKGGGGEVPLVATIGTILSANITVNVPPISAIATVGTVLSQGQLGYVGTIGTILSANITVNAAVSTIVYLATIGTLLNGQISASIESGAMQYIATIGTILGASASGTILFGTVTIERYWSIATLQQNASIVGGFTSTFDMSVWNQISVSVVAGTVTAGSLQAAIMGVDPVSQLVVASIVSSDWLTSGVRQRMTADIIAGETLAVAATIIGTVVGLTVSAERKT
jgi:hypothetical protein